MSLTIRFVLATLPLLFFSACRATPEAKVSTNINDPIESSGERPLKTPDHPLTDAEPSQSPSPPLRPSTQRFETRRIGAPPSANSATRPKRVGPRDMRFNRTRIDNALRLLADVGKFDLVIDGPMPQLVSAQLLSVEPYDALLSMAENHKLRVQYRGGVVRISKAAGSR